MRSPLLQPVLLRPLSLRSGSAVAVRLAAVLSLAGLAALAAAPLFGSAGELDCTFNGTGTKVQSLGSGTDQADDVVVLADGRIVTLNSEEGSSPTGTLRFSRFLASGALDPAFGGGTGTVSVTIPGLTFGDFAFVANALHFVRDSAGRYVVVGSAVVGTDRKVFVGRFTASGALDGTFGGGTGWTTFDWTAGTAGSSTAFDAGRAIAVDANDRPIVGGTVDANGPTFNPSDANFAFARLTTAGALDGTFGTGGITIVSSPGTTTDDTLYDMHLDPSGRIVAVGSSDPNLTTARDAMIVRLTSAGALDATFDGDGIEILDLTQTGSTGVAGDDVAQALAFTPDVPAKIVIAGFAPQTLAIARLTDAGALDTTFGGDGIVNYDFEAGSQNVLEHLFVQPDGKVLVTGWIPFDFSVMRLDTSGGLDATWAGDGRQTVNVLNNDRAYAAALMADGRVVLAGGTGNDTDMALARFLGDSSAVASSLTTITSDLPDPSVAGQSFNVAVSVQATSGATAPTGTITVGDGAQSATCALVPPGSGTTSTTSCALALTTLGNRNLTASYPGNSGLICPSTSSATHQVVANASTTAIVSDLPDPSVTGQPVSVAYSVTALAGSPTGNVTVSDGTTSCTGTVATGGCTLTFPSAGARTLVATYAGDAAVAGSTSAGEPHAVGLAATTTTIVSDAPDASAVGESVTVQYTVAVSSPGSGTPTGTVTVTDGTDSCSATVAAGQCTLALSTPGPRTLTAKYDGDASFSTSTSPGESHTVSQGATTITIDSDNPDPSAVGQSVLVLWTLTPVAPAAGVPTGTVTISVQGGSETCSEPALTGDCALTFTTPGAHTIVATYSGDASFLGSTDTEAHQVVTASSTTSIATDAPDPSVTGQPVTVGFAVTSPSGTPAGSVTVSDGRGGSCTGTLTAGAGSCTLAPTSAGALTLTADYAGDATHAASQGTAPHTVGPASTTLVLQGIAPEPSSPGQATAIAFALTVDTPGAGNPTGTVTVTSGALSCTAPVGDGVCSIAWPSSGTVSVSAAYSGDADFAPSSTAVPLTHAVQTVVDVPTLGEWGLGALAAALAAAAARRLRRARTLGA